jgi:glutamate/tyrosine decarboxylase-like PLP-dependent enzyme
MSTDVERHTIGMVCELLGLSGFDGTITTGATAGNILGLACGREKVVYEVTGEHVSEGGGGRVEVLSAGGHSSVSKASSILGIGRRNCLDLTSDGYAASFNIQELEKQLSLNGMSDKGSIVVATFGEVNTGTFTPRISEISSLCKQYKAWLHIDAAFGILARIHPSKGDLAAGLELADSISFDGHKFFNVPYDCGVFLTRDMTVLSTVCGNVGAAYLGGVSDVGGYSPLNLGLENSRRFRALPLYASLLSLGREGYVDIVVRCCAFAEAMGKEIERSDKFRLLHPVEFNIVLFQAVGYETVEQNERVKDGINGSGKIYLSGTKWKGEGALRIAVCNYLTPHDVGTEATTILSIITSSLPPP